MLLRKDSDWLESGVRSQWQMNSILISLILSSESEVTSAICHYFSNSINRKIRTSEVLNCEEVIK